MTDLLDRYQEYTKEKREEEMKRVRPDMKEKTEQIINQLSILFAPLLNENNTIMTQRLSKEDK
jgi:hypothetical protein